LRHAFDNVDRTLACHDERAAAFKTTAARSYQAVRGHRSSSSISAAFSASPPRASLGLSVH
jgi:uncharacterized membrane-anchored protein YhcB (DUF1043 family)